jgi:hypothetical protein
MKNILAENMLRFGVKNLSEANIKTLHEQNPNATTTTPGAAKPKTYPTQRVEQTFNTIYNGSPAVGKVTGTLLKKEDGSFIPNSIRIDYPSSSGEPFVIYLKPLDGTMTFQIPNNAEGIQNFITSRSAQITKGNLPITAIKLVTDQMSKLSKVPLKMDPKLTNAFALPIGRFGDTKNIDMPAPGLLAPFKIVRMHLVFHPETSKEIHREMHLGGGNQYSYAKDSSGKIIRNGGTGDPNDRLKLTGQNLIELRQAITNAYTALEAKAGPEPA